MRLPAGAIVKLPSWRILVCFSSRKLITSETKFVTTVLLVLCLVLGGNLVAVLAKPENQSNYYHRTPDDNYFSGGGHTNYSNFPKQNPNPQFSPAGWDLQSKQDLIHASVSTFCERCSASQKDKVEQILLLLFNFNNGSTTTSTSQLISSTQNQNIQQVSSEAPTRKNLINPTKKTFLSEKKTKKKKRKQFLRTTSKTFPLIIPTPEHSSGEDAGSFGVIQYPTISTTPQYRLFQYYYSSPSPSSLPISSTTQRTPATTISSALEPVQSVEMPTPPMPPTTTGPIHLYYLASSMASVGAPTTTVVESSVASKPTTLEPS